MVGARKRPFPQKEEIMRYKVKNINLENKKSRYFKRPVFIGGKRLRLGETAIVDEAAITGAMRYVVFEGEAWGREHQLLAIPIIDMKATAPYNPREITVKVDVKAPKEKAKPDKGKTPPAPPANIPFRDEERPDYTEQPATQADDIKGVIPPDFHDEPVTTLAEDVTTLPVTTKAPEPTTTEAEEPVTTKAPAKPKGKGKAKGKGKPKKEEPVTTLAPEEPKKPKSKSKSKSKKGKNKK